MTIRCFVLSIAAVGLMVGTVWSQQLPESQAPKPEQTLNKELVSPYRKWPEEVAYIITDLERQEFKRLQTDEEREQFIEQFWLRRDPTPDTIQNEFQEEFYRRIAYANQHFACGVPGWKTDRGRIYITFGPPDTIDDWRNAPKRPIEEGGGGASTYPFEQWHYNHIADVGDDILIEFVDPTMSGEFRMTLDPSEKSALLRVPDVFRPADIWSIRPKPAFGFNDLESAPTGGITPGVLHLQVRADFIPLTAATTLANITVKFDNKDLQFTDENGVSKAEAHLLGRVASMAGRVVERFEEPVTVQAPTSMLEAVKERQGIYQKSLPLAPGTYQLNVIVKDVASGRMRNYALALHVPLLEEDKLSASSLILADRIEKMPERITAAPFVVGSYKVVPRLSQTFRQDEKLGFYTQIYNLNSGGTIRYEVVRDTSGKRVVDVTEPADESSVRQATIRNLLPLKDFEPGRYTLKLNATNGAGDRTLVRAATFTVTR